MEKPKFKMTRDEMAAFNQICTDTCYNCPQYSGGYGFSMEEIYRNGRKPKELVKAWLDCEVLWEYGYSSDLPEVALEVFSRYKLYKAEKRVWRAKFPRV